MPYIAKERRGRVAPAFINDFPESSGELNYALTQVCLAYLRTYGRSYRTMNDIVGALECAKQEFVRRVVGPHEEKKREEHGDVY